MRARLLRWYDRRVAYNQRRKMTEWDMWLLFRNQEYRQTHRFGGY